MRACLRARVFACLCEWVCACVCASVRVCVCVLGGVCVIRACVHAFIYIYFFFFNVTKIFIYTKLISKAE